MCVGLPMRVYEVEPGFAWCERRGEQRRISTLLIAPPQPGDWLLVFLNDAREKITAERAEQVNHALDLVAQAVTGSDQPGSDHKTGTPALPSAMSLEQINKLTGNRSDMVKDRYDDECKSN